MAGNLIDYRVEKGVAIFELNDPPANTYTYEMNKELDARILDARMDDSVHVIVLARKRRQVLLRRREHQHAFRGHAGVQILFCLHANETLLRLEQTPKLVIAAINGHTVGGGLEIAMAADLRIARQGAGSGLPRSRSACFPARAALLGSMLQARSHL